MHNTTERAIELTVYKDKTYDEERALYGLRDAAVDGCRFAGPADGESALKETSGLTITNCDFLLRYPLWHNSSSTIYNCRMSETCRAALWYDKDIVIKNSVLGGIKALRECTSVKLAASEIDSTEFGWQCGDIEINDCRLISEYPFLHTSGLRIEKLKMKGKYSFQYTENVEIHNSYLDTKDAFWHGKNITVYDSVVKGEYLGWYSENLKFVRCEIIGTQPLCYANNLILEDCTMTDCDLSFENSSVTADIRGDITSVKNPLSGTIRADGIGEIIMDEYAANSTCEIFVKEKKYI